MTAREMQIAFEAQFDLAGLSHPLKSDEIFTLLNEAQDDLVRELFTRFEQSQVISDDLTPLIVKSAELDAKYGGDESAVDGFLYDYVELPADYLFGIASRSEVIYNTAGITYTLPVVTSRVATGSSTTIIVHNRVAQSDDIYQLLSDPFNRTRFKSPICDFATGQINVYTDSKFIIERVFLTYIKTPATIGFDTSAPSDTPSDFPDDLHKEIVDRAVNRLLERTSTVDNQKPEN